jgi:hypothetical protein
MDEEVLEKLWGKPGQPVPPVDASDIEAAYTVYQSAQQCSGGGTLVGLEILERVCSAGANIKAVGYRVLWLGLMTSESNELALLKKDVDDTVFRAIATIPMHWTEIGLELNGPPFDLEDYRRRLGEPV